MGMIKTVNFDHLIEGALTVATQQSGIPLDGAKSTTLNIATFGESKWIGGTVASTNMIFDVKLVFTDMTKKIIIGQRISTSNVGTAFRVGGFYNGTSSFYEGEFTIALLNSGTGPAPLITANKEYYVETIVDFVTGKYAVNVNGLERWSKVYTTAVIAQIAGAFSFYYIGTNGTAANWNAKDMYFSQAVGSEVITPIGPCYVKPVVFTALAGSQFSPAIGLDLLQSLTTKQTDSFSLTYPNGVSDKGALAGDILGSVAGVDYVPANGQIFNLEVWSSASNSSSTSRSMTGKATDGVNTKSGTPAVLTAAMQYNKFNLQMPLALDGTAWSLAKVLGTNFGATVS